MSTTIIPGIKAVENLKANPLSGWPSRNDAENRMEPLCEPGFRPNFHLEPGEKVFTIGSCFARNVEKALAARGFDVVTRRILSAGETFYKFRANILNNYGVPSILNELTWALDGDHPFDPETNLFEVYPDRFVDIHLPAAIKPASKDEVLERRKVITDIVREVRNCRIVVITLGLTEVWYDRQSELYLNYSPRRALVAKHPDRFELHVLSFAETIEYLRRIIALLKRECGDEQRIVLTVSPVPLTATYTDRDVLVANGLSKAVLRAAVDEIISENGHIDYFPSYESITLSDRNAAWEDDQRHVEQEAIDLNIGRMISGYIRHDETDDADLGEIAARARALLGDSGRKKAMRELEPYAGRLGENADLASIYAEACVAVGRNEDAFNAFQLLPAEWGGWRRSVLEARVLTALGRAGNAVAILSVLAAAESKRAAIWQGLAEAHAANGSTDDALASAKSWADLENTSGAPYRLIAAIHRTAGNPDKADTAYRAAMEAEAGGQEFLMDYAEFLIEQKRLGEARTYLEAAIPETRWQEERLERLKLFAS
ncbi:MAG: GSCFA domain-containing protein [Pseudomonadota bacterium]